jgi:glycosyltransferase involved in cell wall biosynthesis
MKIAFVIPAMTAGGAERVAATLSNEWQKAGHAVQLVMFEAPEQKSHYELRPGVDVARLNAVGTNRATVVRVLNNARRIAMLRRHLSAFVPDVTVSFMTSTNILTLLASAGAAWPTVVSERVHVPAHAFERVLRPLRRWVYPRADALVVQTQAMKDWAREQLGVAADVIPNPVDVDRFRQAPGAAADNARERLVAIGRLDPQKGFDLLIEAFANAAGRLENWDLVIYGEGEQRSRLEALIKKFGMEGRISLPGIVRDMPAVYARATAVVHPTRYEGYPNVIAEALAAGKPIIATDCPGGTSELLADGRFGVLIPADDGGALERALVDTLSSRERLAQLGSAARSADTLHRPAQIADRWISLFQRAIAARHGKARPVCAALPD